MIYLNYNATSLKIKLLLKFGGFGSQYDKNYSENNIIRYQKPRLCPGNYADFKRRKRPQKRSREEAGSMGWNVHEDM